MVVEQPAYPGVGRLGSHAESGLHGRPARARENGTLHWQFAIQWSHSRSFAAIKKDLPLAHFEVRSWAAAVSTARRRTLGTPGHGSTVTGLPAGSARLRPRTGTRGILSPRRGALRKIPAKIQIKHLGNLERIHRQNLKFIDQTDVRGVWIWGKPGVGKSHFARQVLGLVLPKLNNKWWDGYQSQKVVIMEDVDKETIKFLHHHLKIWSDRWGFIGETKGGAVAPSHRWLVVTSNYSIADILADLEDRELRTAIMRRFTRFEMLSRDEIKAWDGDYQVHPPEAVAAMFK